MSKQKQKEPLSLMIAKTILAIAVFTGIGTIIFGGGVVIMKYYGNEANNKIVEPVNQETGNCAKAGESVGSCVGCKKCCQGLQPMVNLKYNGECVNLPAPGSGGVCSNCGNGICDDKNNEDECNCPEDCGKIKIPDRAIYKSEKLGIMFKYPAWWKNLPEENFKDTIIEKNNTIKSTAMQGSSITVFEKSENETIEKAIEKIIKKEGVDLENCKIIAKKQNTPKDSNDINISISLKENYEPNNDEIMAKIGNIDSLEELDIICKTTPECTWAKQNLVEEKTKLKCSRYAKCFGYKCGSSFIYQPNNSEEKFIYIQSMAGTPPFWQSNSIEILKDQSDTSDWQTYRNEEFGFEFQYPENQLSSYHKDITFLNNEITIKSVDDIKKEFETMAEMLSSYGVQKEIGFPEAMNRKIKILSEASDCSYPENFENDIKEITDQLRRGIGKTAKVEGIYNDNLKKCGIKIIDNEGYSVIMDNYDYTVQFLENDQIITFAFSLFPEGKFKDIDEFLADLSYTDYENLYSSGDILDKEITTKIIERYDQIISTFKFIEN